MYLTQMARSPFFFPVLLAALAGACSSSSSDSTNSNSVSGSDSGTPEPAEPTADVSEEITGGNGAFIGAASGNVVPDGYVEHEYFAAGTATAYASSAGASLSDDGRWTFEPTTTAMYRTRVLVLRPANAADFSGTVLIEWLNVSGGVDANPDYASLEEEIVRQHHIWIGVSAQLIGVEGGPVLVSVPIAMASDLAGKGLKGIDPARYGTLSHPGDGYSFDIYTQVARAVRQGGPLLDGATPQFVLAVGESQSAIALTTYYDGVQPLTHAFDGFFVHSRGAVALPLVGPGEYADLAGAIGSTTHPVFRDDLDAPVFEIQAESDVTGVLNSSAVRQPDSDRFRLWEVAGTAHADVHLLGSTASSIDCGVPINNGPMHLVAKAAFHGLESWVRAATLPPTSPLLELTAATPQAVSRDADGIALGGVRTPPVDVPVDVLSGDPGPTPSLICILLGSTTPLPDTRLAELYTNRTAYQDQYAASADQTIQGGFVLDADRDALIAYSQPLRITP
jgi:hypothetical protein